MDTTTDHITPCSRMRARGNNQIHLVDVASLHAQITMHGFWPLELSPLVTGPFLRDQSLVPVKLLHSPRTCCNNPVMRFIEGVTNLIGGCGMSLIQFITYKSGAVRGNGLGL